MKVKEESEKAGLKLNIQKMKIMASSPIASWQVSGETTETVRDCIFFGSKITVEIKRLLLLGRKAMTNLDSKLKIRDLTLQAKVRIVKAVIFLVVIFGCVSWTIKKADCRRIHAFELWYWRRLLARPLDSKIKPVNPKGNQPSIFIVKNDAEAEAPILWPPGVKSQLIGKEPNSFPDAGKD